MNRRDLVQAVATHTGKERKDVDEVLKGFTEVVTAIVAKGEPVAISGFAKFVKVDRPARMGRNPQTGEPVRIKASKKARITALKAFKDSVMSPGQAPKLAKGVWPPAPAPKPAKKAAAKKTTAKKTTAKKTTAKKTAAKKTVAKKAAPATRKSAATRKTASTRKSAAKRPAAKKTAARRR